MHYLTSTLDGGEWSASHPGYFTPRERAPSTHWIGGWVGPRYGLDILQKIISFDTTLKSLHTLLSHNVQVFPTLFFVGE
jgi:hypothetical protein